MGSGNLAGRTVTPKFRYYLGQRLLAPLSYSYAELKSSARLPDERCAGVVFIPRKKDFFVAVID